MNTQQPHRLNVYSYLAKACNVSERTVKAAFQREPISNANARKIARELNISPLHFRVKPPRTK